ncbi:MAG TPA: cytochrome c5 family protein [Chlorobaculum parvum]|uniref:Cytochrome c5 family protein n=1 Tax=Chlorobaculum parvum TaxID=274539 RepID=A0A7C5DBL7_9CHLB|nr:cytochrome c5 family protein [Chlorobaculum parvum]
MKRFLPLLTLGLIVLGGCGLEKPPAKLAEEIDKADKGVKSEKTEEPATAPAEEAAAPAEEELTPELAAGKEIYDAHCAMCHDSGMMNAPKPGDKAAWEPRLAQGMDTVMKHTIEGLNGMPAKGGAADLTDDQLKSAVDYLTHNAK